MKNKYGRKSRCFPGKPDVIVNFLFPQEGVWLGGEQQGTPNPAASNTAAVGKTSGESSEEGSTEASAWSFDGEAYVPDSSDNTEDSSEETQEYEEDGSDTDKMETEQQTTSNLPSWLSILLGFLSTGGLSAAFRVPWPELKDKLQLYLSRRRG